MELSDKVKYARQKLMGMGCGIGAGTMSGVVSRQGQTKWMGKESEHPNQNPMTLKGKKIMSGMKKQYGKKKGKQVFYASVNKGTIKGVE